MFSNRVGIKQLYDCESFVKKGSLSLCIAFTMNDAQTTLSTYSCFIPINNRCLSCFKRLLETSNCFTVSIRSYLNKRQTFGCKADLGEDGRFYERT